MGKLSSEQIQFYEDNGYLLVPKVFQPAECRKILELYVSRSKEFLGSETMNLDRTVPEVGTFVRDTRIADIAEGLHNDAPMDYLMVHAIFKRPGTPYAKHAWNPHQDVHYNGHPKRMGALVTVAIEDSDPGNGGMFVYTGSHKLPLLYHAPNESYGLGTTPGDKCTVPEEFLDKKTDLAMKQGDVYVQDGHLIHGSYSNDSNRSRTQLGIVVIVRGQSYNKGGKHANRLPRPLRD
jgi:2-aminoethylphosphonate dioxygenase